jgi:hypothetical protein
MDSSQHGEFLSTQGGTLIQDWCFYFETFGAMQTTDLAIAKSPHKASLSSHLPATALGVSFLAQS